MSSSYIIVSSITYAYKGKSMLERRGCSVFIERAPTQLSKCGCHYSLRIRDYPLERALDILRNGHVRIISYGSGDYDLS